MTAQRNMHKTSKIQLDLKAMQKLLVDHCKATKRKTWQDKSTDKKDERTDEDKEVNLGNVDDIVCWNCGKPGHKSFVCQSQRRGRGSGRSNTDHSRGGRDSREQ
jgi:hypothetical protein